MPSICARKPTPLVLQRELDVAAEWQRRLLPQQAIQRPGWSRGFNVAARIVGGDFYDLLDLSQGRRVFAQQKFALLIFPVSAILIVVCSRRSRVRFQFCVIYKKHKLFLVSIP
jgi:hypothetical protein